jgi:pantoate--beta-alanine ligase
MHIFREIAPLKAYLNQQVLMGKTVGLVPTMGALHSGHLSLIQRARTENDVVVCSIYVNPTQFNNLQDLQKYPRDNARDFKMLEEALCDITFCPSDAEMYPETSLLKFDLGDLDKTLEGEFRPGHFSGVALVVSKLLNIVLPHRAYFGQKDFQQFKVVTRLRDELKFNTTLISVPIIREFDGLAMSSRNSRLDVEGRRRAGVLYQSLQLMKTGLIRGQSFSELKTEAAKLCLENQLRLEYLVMAQKSDLTIVQHVVQPENTILLIAAYVGDVRLIDNLFLA